MISLEPVWNLNEMIKTIARLNEAHLYYHTPLLAIRRFFQRNTCTQAVMNKDVGAWYQVEITYQAPRTGLSSPE